MAHTSSPENTTFGLLIRDVSRLIRRRFERKATRVGLSQGQSAVMFSLAHQEGVHQAVLAERLDIEPIALVGLLDKLEHAGFVKRRPDPSDRRARQIYLTEKARPLLKELQHIRTELRQEAFAGIPASQQEQIISTLQQVKDNLRQFKR